MGSNSLFQESTPAMDNLFNLKTVIFWLKVQLSISCMFHSYLQNLPNMYISISHALNSWVKVFRINPEFRILRLTFHRKSASKC